MKCHILGKTGLKVSQLSFGAASLGSMYRSVDESEGIRAVHIALDLGINFFDVSPFYGGTVAETVLGKALKDISRDKYYLATKTGRFYKPGYCYYRDTEFDFTRKRIFQSFEESCRRLNVDYLDLLQLHDIENVDLNQIAEEAIPALQELKKKGKIRFCGITGYPLKIFRVILGRTEVDTILSFCHYSLNDTSLLSLMGLIKEKNVGLINASSLTMGLFTSKEIPDWHPASDDVKEVCRKAVEHCAKKKANISKLALQFSVANEDIPTTLLGTANPENVKKNVAWIEEPIDEDLLQEVQEILKPIHNQVWVEGRTENN